MLFGFRVKSTGEDSVERGMMVIRMEEYMDRMDG